MEEQTTPKVTRRDERRLLKVAIEAVKSDFPNPERFGCPGSVALKAIASELWLDPLRDGWSTSYVSAVARTEFSGRPLGGQYEIVMAAGPDVRLDRIATCPSS